MNAGGPGTGWFIDSAIVDGQDTLDFPFEVKPGAAPSGAVITFTDRQAQLSGTITNQRGQPAPEQTLILYPADERYWVPQSRRIRSTRPSTDGQFSFAGIPAGDYKIVAMVDVEPGGRVLVRLLGACTGCSMSQLTLKQGIENLLLHRVEGVTSVDAVFEETPAE